MSERLNASLAGYMAFEPKPSASRWYGVNRSADPSPEKTVTIVTVWPSSRRLAISPPHDSATSSGCGATKTCVMPRRVYRAVSANRRSVVLEPAGTDERHEHACAVGLLEPLVAVSRHDHQLLMVARPDRDHEPASVAELVTERLRDRRRGGCDDDRVPGGADGVAEAAVCLADRHGVCETRGLEPRARLGYERPLPLDRCYVRAEPRQDGRLIAGSRPDLEDAIAGSDREVPGHLGAHVRLADRLAGSDRERLVRVRVA